MPAVNASPKETAGLPLGEPNCWVDSCQHRLLADITLRFNFQILDSDVLSYAILRFTPTILLRQIVFYPGLDLQHSIRYFTMADDTAHSFRQRIPSAEESSARANTIPVQYTLNNRPGFSRDPLQQLALAEEFIRNNICNFVSISDIANAAGVNIRALQRLFRKYRGATPIQVLLNSRIAAAHEIIYSGKATSVRELAAKLHFSNPGRFSKLYRKTYSVVPSEHIRAYQSDKAKPRD
ncbi:helix-turn-helix transcriptional regulator [Phyllobacterium zundukense]|uniref:Helix-turn-helix domain-containing protein n=1 Tax=Phyllobacterium zundukense TaxID=1867719 RepID=A0ACD4CWX9_9HYPH|nr:helix-turn-helix transcriptional regulator [Phyllobacterium zundukense]UXN58095.1 helix-turn-helix domain-containing protein [Phyllobacterium zundukense]